MFLLCREKRTLICIPPCSCMAASSACRSQILHRLFEIAAKLLSLHLHALLAGVTAPAPHFSHLLRWRSLCAKTAIAALQMEQAHCTSAYSKKPPALLTLEHELVDDLRAIVWHAGAVTNALTQFTSARAAAATHTTFMLATVSSACYCRAQGSSKHGCLVQKKQCSVFSCMHTQHLKLCSFSQVFTMRCCCTVVALASLSCASAFVLAPAHLSTAAVQSQRCVQTQTSVKRPLRGVHD
jgi:hypothetical protein